MFMLFLGLGIVLLALRYFEIGMVATWSWWVVLSPFPLAMAWWLLADHFGYTARKAMEREDLRKQKRIEKNRAGLGLRPRR
jgi:small Trp-rich protein